MYEWCWPPIAAIIRKTNANGDSYSIEEITAFDTLFLSGFEWEYKEKAEDLVVKSAQAGTRVVIDLAGTTPDALARIPTFLDVWAEVVTFWSEAAELMRDDMAYALPPFVVNNSDWTTLSLQGLAVSGFGIAGLVVMGVKSRKEKIAAE